MGYSFNGLTRRITLTSGTTAFLANDLYSRWKDWVRSGNAQWLPAFTSVGGESIGGGLTSGFYLFLQNGWSIIPDSIDHTLTVQGNLIRSPDDLSGEPVFQPVSASVLIIQQSSAVAIGYSTGGGTSLTPTDIWTHPTRSLTDKTGFSLTSGERSIIAATVETQLANEFSAIQSKVDQIQINGGKVVATIGSDIVTLPAGLESRLLEVWRLLGLDSANPATITPTQQSVGGVTITIASSNSGNTVTLTRQP